LCSLGFLLFLLADLEAVHRIEHSLDHGLGDVDSNEFVTHECHLHSTRASESDMFAWLWNNQERTRLKGSLVNLS